MNKFFSNLANAKLPKSLGTIPYADEKHSLKQKKAPKAPTGMVELKGIGEIPFEDATAPLKIEITESDFANAICGSPTDCVVAQAFHRALGPFFSHVIVGKTVIHVVIEGKRSIRYGINSQLRRAINVFDKTKQWHLPEGMYEIPVPSKTAKRGGRPNRHHLYGGKGGSKTRLGIKLSTPTRMIIARKAA